MVSRSSGSAGALLAWDLVQIDPCSMLFYARSKSDSKLGLNLVLPMTKLSQFLMSWSDFYGHHGECMFSLSWSLPCLSFKESLSWVFLV